MAVDDRCCNQSRLSSIHLYRLHHVVLKCHNTHWIWLGLLLWKSYICLLIQWGCVLMGCICVFLAGSLVASRGKSNQHWSPQMRRLPQPWDLQDVLGVGTCLLAHLAWGHTDLWWFGRIRAGHDVPDFQCRHVFWDSKSWTASADVPPRELHWSQHTNWRLGWCRMLQAPVLIQCCGCCPVVAGWCLMLCHTRHNHSPAWSEQWPGTASTVCLGPLPTSSAQPLEGDSGPPCTLF